jgi:hypothetical protein
MGQQKPQVHRRHVACGSTGRLEPTLLTQTTLHAHGFVVSPVSESNNERIRLEEENRKCVAGYSLRTLHYFASLHSSSHYFTTQFTSLHFTSLHFTSLHFTSLHFTSQHITLHHSSSHHFTLHHITSLFITSLSKLLTSTHHPFPLWAESCEWSANPSVFSDPLNHMHNRQPMNKSITNYDIVNIQSLCVCFVKHMCCIISGLVGIISRHIPLSVGLLSASMLAPSAAIGAPVGFLISSDSFLKSSSDSTFNVTLFCLSERSFFSFCVC